MTDADRMLQAACREPADTAARQAAADALREVGEEDLAHALESDLGAGLVARLHEISETVTLPPSVRLLWAAHHVIPRLPSTHARGWVNHQQATREIVELFQERAAGDQAADTARRLDHVRRATSARQELERVRNAATLAAHERRQEVMRAATAADRPGEAPRPDASVAEYQRLARELNARLAREGIADRPVVDPNATDTT